MFRSFDWVNLAIVLPLFVLGIYLYPVDLIDSR